MFMWRSLRPRHVAQVLSKRQSTAYAVSREMSPSAANGPARATLSADHVAQAHPEAASTLHRR